MSLQRRKACLLADRHYSRVSAERQYNWGEAKSREAYQCLAIHIGDTDHVDALQ